MSLVAGLEDFDFHTIFYFTRQTVPLVTDPDTEEVFPYIQSSCWNHDI